MNYTLLSGIFLEGILSFFSPCVLPLIPLYMSYLAGDHKHSDEEGNITYDNKKVFLTTLFFVMGISLTFLLLAMSISAISVFLDRYREAISIIGGTLLILFGLHECDLIHIDLLNKELKPKIDLKLQEMNYLKAFLLGFVFSLGWSPCIGPMLANAILLAASDEGGYLYIIVYALGLVIPFLITGLFTNKVLSFIQKNRKIMNTVMKIAGIVLICFGLYMISDGIRKIDQAKTLSENPINEEEDKQDIGSYLYHYEFKDKDGNVLRLSDYEGNYIMINFTASWCTYCKMEIPDFQEFANENDVKCFFIMSPLNEEKGREDIDKFLEEYDPSLPVIIDEEGIMFYYCGINSYPTTYVIDPQGHFVCYANGAMSKEGFEGLLDYSKQLDE
ncbi:MAG: redoxin domain-containing protein [Erysipelotrichaceae bacterium]|nr:redoxin domain-containing protein [Erysipelotrichaceae bacterium]